MQDEQEELKVVEKMLAFLERRRTRLIHELTGQGSEVVERTNQPEPGKQPWDLTSR